MGAGAGARFRFRMLLAGLLLGVPGCVPLPVHVIPPVTGQVLDDHTQQPVEGAVVVLRYDARHGDLLPDRDLLGHREARTDARGRFQIPRGATPGLSAWPIVSTEARVVAVMKAGYRCASPRGVNRRTGAVTVRLTPAEDEADRRASCRPVAARPSETPVYLAAWRALYPRDGRAGRMADERPLERLLEARRMFGPGESCSGPAVDLSLAPGGERVAVTLEEAGHRRIEVIEMSGSGRVVASLPSPAEPDPARPRRLAWASGGELVLWERGVLDPTLQASGLGALGDATPEVVWRGAMPPARPDAGGAARLEPIDAAERYDEGEARWLGRAFHVARTLDPVTGRASETLRTQTPEGEEHAVALPGEPCGPTGQYGRPHYRITADPEVGVDLRYVDGGCHAVAIHLASGKWKRIDGSRVAGICDGTRRVPLPRLRAAVRGYVRDLEETLRAAGGDPAASYTLRIGRNGRTMLEARDVLGERLELVVAPFPIETPLSRIDVTALGNAGEGSALLPPPAAAAEPVLEPL